MSGVNLSIWGSIPEGNEHFSHRGEDNVLRVSPRYCSMSIAKRGIQTEF